MSVSVVMFDLDDTVFDHRGAVAAGVLEHRRALGAPLADADDLAELARWEALEEEHYPRWLSGELDFREQRRVRVREFVAPYGIDLSDDADADAWFDGYLRQYQRAWAIHEDAVPCFDELEQRIHGVRFGVITNGELESQTAKLIAIALDVRLDHVIASGEVGVAKPDQRIFEIACERFGVAPGDAAYIGDRLHTDAIGAAAAGLTGVWLARHGASDEDRAEGAAAGVHVIATLVELPAILAP